jgi:hypothetical protein
VARLIELIGLIALTGQVAGRSPVFRGASVRSQCPLLGSSPFVAPNRLAAPAEGGRMAKEVMRFGFIWMFQSAILNTFVRNVTLRD